MLVSGRTHFSLFYAFQTSGGRVEYGMDTDGFRNWLLNVKTPPNSVHSATNYCSYCQRIESFYGNLEDEYNKNDFENWLEELSIPKLRFDVTGDLKHNANTYKTALKTYRCYCDYALNNPHTRAKYEHRSRNSSSDEFKDFQDWLLGQIGLASVAQYITYCKRIGRSKLDDAYYGDFWRDVVASPNDYADPPISPTGIRNAMSALNKFFLFMRERGE